MNLELGDGVELWFKDDNGQAWRLDEEEGLCPTIRGRSAALARLLCLRAAERLSRFQDTQPEPTNIDF